MAESTIPITIYSGDKIEFDQNGLVNREQFQSRGTVIVEHKLSYDELVDLICARLKVDRKNFHLRIFLYCDHVHHKATLIEDDCTLEVLYYLAHRTINFWPELYVQMEEIPQSSVQRDLFLPHDRSKGLVALLQSFEESVSFVGFSCGAAQLSSLPTSTYVPPVFVDYAPQDVNFPPISYQSPTRMNDAFTSDEERNSHCSESECPSFNDVEGDESDEEVLDKRERSQGTFPLFSDRVIEFMNDIGDANGAALVDQEDTVQIDMWSASENQIRLRMRFESKAQLKKAITMWSLSQNREFKVVESRRNTWAAKCKMELDGENYHDSSVAQCNWCVRAVLKTTHKMWQITKWVNGHNCLGFTNGNNNRNLTSAFVASYILHSVEANPGYVVKMIQADIKHRLFVDISYKKAWHGRRKAIEIAFGDWDSNFVQLPKYIAALERSNPNTVVQWLFHPRSSANVKIFKYVFWAFGPAIEAFHKCRPVICIDGTHLRGTYKGKLLVAVTKDANNKILPIAFAIVDEETVESWSWFLVQFRLFVAQNRSLCVISDRHGGIIHAMENLEDWQEPFAYHRFCLRHVRSNFMTRFKNLALKKLCWAIGSTTQKRKFRNCRRDVMAINADAWEYLNAIDRTKWCLAYDGNHRWGCLTTNNSESFNNVLKGARHLPILACIESSFRKTVSLFRISSERAHHCNTVLPPDVWKSFKECEILAQGHQVDEFDYTEGVYRVITVRRPNGKGGNPQTVYYYQQKCTCGKWQMNRFPCSHALAVCRKRGDAPANIVNEVYLNKTYKAQYAGKFFPIPHPDYWPNPGYEIRADPTKYAVHGRGRMRESRIPNEMDQTHPDEPRKCGICHLPGHTRRKCPNSQPRVYRDDNI